MRLRQSCVISKGFATVASLLAVAIGCLVSATARADSEQPGRFRAACVKVDITPDTPQWLQGYGPRQSTGVHDRIYHRIAILDDGTTTFCLVSTDICTILPSFYRDFCEKLQRETPIRSENFWWSTTHTHSAPHVGPQDLARLFAGTLGDRFSIQHDTNYWASVADKLIGGINQAHSQLEPARLGIAAGTAAANVNRRQRNADGRTVLGVNPEGPADRQLGVFRLERPDGSLIGLIANFTIHGTALGGGNTRITGDAPGFAAQYVERSTGVPLLFINGSLGNVAPLPNNAILVFPVAELLTPDGKAVEGHGVIPDIPVPLDRGQLLDGIDAQLQAAIQHIVETVR